VGGFLFGRAAAEHGLRPDVAAAAPGAAWRGGAENDSPAFLRLVRVAACHAVDLRHVARLHPEALRGPAVYVANHPGLLDATFILARLPDTICIFKPALIRNPAMGPAAIMAEYASGESGST